MVITFFGRETGNNLRHAEKGRRGKRRVSKIQEYAEATREWKLECTDVELQRREHREVSDCSRQEGTINSTVVVHGTRSKDISAARGLAWTHWVSESLHLNDLQLLNHILSPVRSGCPMV